MFSRTTTNAQQPHISTAPRRIDTPLPSPTPQGDGGPARRPIAASILAADLVFEGNISGEGELMIDGAVKGDIRVARLVIGEHAHVEGAVRGDQIDIHGHVQGSVEGKAVRLLETAHIEGDIAYEQLSIEVGAFFQGRCAQIRPAPPTPTAQSVQMLAPAMVEPQPANVIDLERAAQG